MPEGDVQADSLGDLPTKGNKLSVWFIKENMSNLERVITALAANCDSISNFDYALFSEEILKNETIKVEKSKGESKDGEANDEWHRDLCELSAKKMLYIAQHIFNEGKIERIQEKQIGQQISNAVKTGTIKLAALKEGIRTKINI